MQTVLDDSMVAAASGAYHVDQSDLSNRIYQAFKNMILSGQLAAGQRLSLEEYAGHFRVSVTPVRDALRALAADGLVDLQQRRGAFVTRPSEALVREVFQIREILECSAVDSALRLGPAVTEEMERVIDEIAATTVGDSHTDYLTYIRLDQRFHQCLIDCLGNRKLSEIWAGLRSFTLITLVLCRATNQRAANTLDEHWAIVSALRAGDGEAARRCIGDHLRNAKEELVSQLSQRAAQPRVEEPA